MEVNKQKSEAYKNLVSEMQKRYPVYQTTPLGRKAELWAPPYEKNANGDLECICKEINLYTYWQGIDYAKYTPKIKYLFVGHDWDNPFKTTPAMTSFRNRIRKMNAGDREIPYFDTKTEYPTDKNLVELFKELKPKYYIDIKRYEELFFTNFCLGYLTEGKVDKKLMMQDADLFRDLVKILEPEKILCLGQDTFMCVYYALKNDEATNFDSRVVGKYNEFLDNHSQINIRYGGNDIRIYPLAHCGSRGKQNRPLNIQKQDWKKIP